MDQDSFPDFPIMLKFQLKKTMNCNRE